VTDTSSRKSGDARSAGAPHAALVCEAALPSRYRMIVVLHEVEGLSTREVAEVTGISEGERQDAAASRADDAAA
jgi:DNA-directed RNA polymerase specialized sigma24 family protein